MKLYATFVTLLLFNDLVADSAGAVLVHNQFPNKINIYIYKLN